MLFPGFVVRLTGANEALITGGVKSLALNSPEASLLFGQSNEYLLTPEIDSSEAINVTIERFMIVSSQTYWMSVLDVISYRAKLDVQAPAQDLRRKVTYMR